MVNKTYHPKHYDENDSSDWQNPFQHHISQLLRVSYPHIFFPQHGGDLIIRMNLIQLYKTVNKHLFFSFDLSQGVKHHGHEGVEHREDQPHVNRLDGPGLGEGIGNAKKTATVSCVKAKNKQCEPTMSSEPGAQ